MKDKDKNEGVLSRAEMKDWTTYTHLGVTVPSATASEDIPPGFHSLPEEDEGAFPAPDVGASRAASRPCLPEPYPITVSSAQLAD